MNNMTTNIGWSECDRGVVSMAPHETYVVQKSGKVVETFNGKACLILEGPCATCENFPCNTLH